MSETKITSKLTSKLTRKDLANPYSEMTFEEQLKLSKAIDLRENSIIIDKKNGYISIIPIDENKTY